MLPFKPRQTYDPNHVRVLASRLLKLEKLQENQLVTQDMITFNQWNWSLWFQNRYIETKYQFGDYVLWFPRAIKMKQKRYRKGFSGFKWDPKRSNGQIKPI